MIAARLPLDKTIEIGDGQPTRVEEFTERVPEFG